MTKASKRTDGKEKEVEKGYKRATFYWKRRFEAEKKRTGKEKRKSERCRQSTKKERAGQIKV